MRNVSEQTWNAWRSRVKVGDTRPVVRATIQAARIRLTPYNTDAAPGSDYDGTRRHGGVYANMLFGGNEAIREIPNIRSLSWGRSVDQEVSECSLTILNAGLIGIGVNPLSPTYDLPGALTPGKGIQATPEAAERWGHDTDLGWNDSIRPDRLLKTYEGYGADPDLAPGLDPHLYQSGTWLIDEVQFAANGDLIIKARDLGRLLLDHIAFPPVLPLDYYPLSWGRERTEYVTGRTPTGGKWGVVYGTTSSSNDYYVGEGIIDTPAYVDSNGAWQGNTSYMGIRGSWETSWRSTGQTGPTDKVWWQVDLNNPKAISALRIWPFSGPYRVHISLHNGTRWLGSKRIPYDVTTEGIDIEAGIPYVGVVYTDVNRRFEHVLQRKYAGIQKIRLTFTNLRRSGGITYPWQAGLRDLQLYTGNFADLGFGTGQVLRTVGNIRDFTHAVQNVCGWAGFWQPDNPDLQWQRYSTFGEKVYFPYTGTLLAMGRGRPWGSYQISGTVPIADLTADQFDKQPLMQTITVIKEMLGFLFFIDETGGPVWRLPNIYTFGNWRNPGHRGGHRVPTRVTDYVAIDEADTLVDYTARESSRNLREQVAVSDVQGKRGAVVAGYQPPGTPAKLRRMAMWSDSNFATNREAKVAADLVASRQMFDYRRGKVTIWGNPAIQLDDQIRIFERVTNETFFHYVLGIQSNLDMEAGTWDYSIETHWLGKSTNDGEWVMNTTKLASETNAYLDLLGGIE